MTDAAILDAPYAAVPGAGSQGAVEMGFSSFAAILADPATGRVPSSAERLTELLQEVVTADQMGLDAFGVGERHRPEIVSQVLQERSGGAAPVDRG